LLDLRLYTETIASGRERGIRGIVSPNRRGSGLRVRGYSAHAALDNAVRAWNFCICIPFFSVPSGGLFMVTVAHVQPILALIAGILILLVPRLLNYIVAIYLIIVGVAGLGLIR
jgi:hypothetical protein